MDIDYQNAINLLALKGFVAKQLEALPLDDLELCFRLDYLLNYLINYIPSELLDCKLITLISTFCSMHNVDCGTIVLDYALNPLTGNVHFILTDGAENVYYVYPSCRILEEEPY